MKTKNTTTILSALTAAIFCMRAAEASAAENAQTVHLAIQGMVTDNCPVLVKTALSKLDGVKSVEASLKSKSAQVQFDANKLSAAKLVSVLKDQVGFDAKIVKTARFAIKGMVTDNCPVLVKTALAKQKGVTGVRASLESKSAEVEYLDGVITPKAIQAVIKDQVGFDSEIVSAG